MIAPAGVLLLGPCQVERQVSWIVVRYVCVASPKAIGKLLAHTYVKQSNTACCRQLKELQQLRSASLKQS